MPRGRSAQAQRELQDVEDVVEALVGTPEDHQAAALLQHMDVPVGALLQQAADAALAVQPHLPTLAPTKFDQVQARIKAMVTKRGGMEDRLLKNVADRRAEIDDLNQTIEVLQDFARRLKAEQDAGTGT